MAALKLEVNDLVVQATEAIWVGQTVVIASVDLVVLSGLEAQEIN